VPIAPSSRQLLTLWITPVATGNAKSSANRWRGEGADDASRACIDSPVAPSATAADRQTANCLKRETRATATLRAASIETRIEFSVESHELVRTRGNRLRLR
jgi:hypothetical protein